MGSNQLLVLGEKMIKDIKGLEEKIISEIRSRTDKAVIGLSGGADSTLMAILCVKALGKENVYGVHMPYNQKDADTFNSDSKKLAVKLGIRQFSVPVGNIADAVIKGVTGAFRDEKSEISLSKVNEGNARARARMCVLYGIAHQLESETKKRVRVPGTGNLSEDWIGFDTKWGDAACDFFPIGQLFKSEVYQLLEYYRDQGVITEEMINRIPSPGFWDGHTDEEELGYSYNEMEPSIKRYMSYTSKLLKNLLEKAGYLSEVDRFVIGRHLANVHKHEASPAFEVRKFCVN